jgi:hypothetical protein
MPQRHVFIVLTNPAEGRDDEYNDWYSNTHIADVLTVPGVVAAQRFKLSDKQRMAGKLPWQYLAIYECETDDLDEVINALKERSGGETMPLTSALADERVSWFFHPVTERAVAG